jgi:hypothetical protein
MRPANTGLSGQSPQILGEAHGDVHPIMQKAQYANTLARENTEENIMTFIAAEISVQLQRRWYDQPAGKFSPKSRRL